MFDACVFCVCERRDLQHRVVKSGEEGNEMGMSGDEDQVDGAFFSQQQGLWGT